MQGPWGGGQRGEGEKRVGEREGLGQERVGREGRRVGEGEWVGEEEKRDWRREGGAGRGIGGERIVFELNQPLSCACDDVSE